MEDPRAGTLFLRLENPRNEAGHPKWIEKPDFIYMHRTFAWRSLQERVIYLHRPVSTAAAAHDL
eukprot:2039722-Rhodomonas_salina.1